MPARDGTGPRGMGPTTGRGKGFCNPQSRGIIKPSKGESSLLSDFLPPAFPPAGERLPGIFSSRDLELFAPVLPAWEKAAEDGGSKRKGGVQCITDRGMGRGLAEEWAAATAGAWASPSGDLPRPGPMWEGEEAGCPAAGLLRGMALLRPLMIPEWFPRGPGPWGAGPVLMEPPIIPGRKKFAS